MSKSISKAVFWGSSATLLLLGFYFFVLSLVSGWNFAQTQFAEFWFWVIALSIGFGVQIGLYTYLRNAMRSPRAGGGVVAVSGTASTAAMISCCAHYLVNILPVLGASGLLVIIGQYQTEFFWIGAVFNLFGIAYIGNEVIKFKRSYEAGQIISKRKSVVKDIT